MKQDTVERVMKLYNTVYCVRFGISYYDIYSHNPGCAGSMSDEGAAQTEFRADRIIFNMGSYGKTEIMSDSQKSLLLNDF